MAASNDSGFKLTREHVMHAFSYLQEVHDIDKRNTFFSKYMIDNVTWEVTGNGHSMAGVRYSVAEHTAATFARLRVKIIDPIKFVVRSIILDSEAQEACIELYGYATTLNGQPYNNDYVWLTQWNDQGQITSVRTYHDTHLAEKVLQEEV